MIARDVELTDATGHHRRFDITWRHVPSEDQRASYLLEVATETAGADDRRCPARVVAGGGGRPRRRPAEPATRTPRRPAGGRAVAPRPRAAQRQSRARSTGTSRPTELAPSDQLAQLLEVEPHAVADNRGGARAFRAPARQGADPDRAARASGRRDRRVLLRVSAQEREGARALGHRERARVDALARRPAADLPRHAARHHRVSRDGAGAAAPARAVARSDASVRRARARGSPARGARFAKSASASTSASATICTTGSARSSRACRCS